MRKCYFMRDDLRGWNRVANMVNVDGGRQD
jgi:hypothetical protein